MKRLVSVLLVTALICGVFSVQTGRAEEDMLSSTWPQEDRTPQGEWILADLLVARPLGIAACAVGFAGSILSIPFAAMSNSDQDVSRRLIAEPFASTFTRPLGRFDAP